MKKRALVSILAIVMTLALVDVAEARRPKHAHLVKHPHQVLYAIMVPASALKAKPRHPHGATKAKKRTTR